MEVFYQTGVDTDARKFRIFPVANLTFPAHLHTSFELLFLQEGTLSVTANGVTGQLAAGEIFVALPNDIHSYTAAPAAESHGILMQFADSFSGSLQHIFSKYTLSEHIFTVRDWDVEALCRKLEGKENEKYAPLLVEGYVDTLFYEILTGASLVERKNEAEPGLIKKLLLLIQKEYDSGMNLNETATALGLSRSYVSKFFRRKIGCGFNEYCNRLRVEKAKNLLSGGKLGILDIAIDCGFDGQRSFDRVFKKYIGMAPTEYRNQ